MELRNHIRTPHRYKPEDPEDPPDIQGTWWYSSGRAPKKMPLPIPYNPHLPPAAFPTLDAPTRKPSEIDELIVRGHLAGLDSTRRLADKHSEMEIDRTLSPPAISQTLGLTGNSRGHLASRVHSSPAKQRGFDVGLQSFDAGMQTSDEEYVSNTDTTMDLDKGSPRGNRQRQWDDISDVHKLEILHGLMRHDESVETAIASLGISREQLGKVIQMDTRRIQALERAQSKMNLLDEDVHHILITDVKNAAMKLTDTGYDYLFCNHFGRFFDPEMDLAYSTTRYQLNKAIEFLVSRGLHRSLAGQWSEPLYIRLPEKYEQSVQAKGITPAGKTIAADIKTALEKPSQISDAAQKYTSYANEERGISLLDRNMPFTKIKKNLDTKQAPLSSWSGAENSASSDILVPAVLDNLSESPSASSLPTICADPWSMMSYPPQMLLQDQHIHSTEDTLSVVVGNASIKPSAPVGSAVPFEDTYTVVATVERGDSSTTLVRPGQKYHGTARSTMPMTSSLRKSQEAHGRFQASAEIIRQGSATSDTLEWQRVGSMKHTGKTIAHLLNPPLKEDSCTKANQNVPRPEKMTLLPIASASSVTKKWHESAQRNSPNLRTPGRGSSMIGVPVGSGPSTRSRRTIQKPVRYRDHNSSSNQTTPTRGSTQADQVNSGPQSLGKVEIALGKGRKRTSGEGLEQNTAGARERRSKKHIRASLPGPGAFQTGMKERSGAGSMVSIASITANASTDGATNRAKVTRKRSVLLLEANLEARESHAVLQQNLDSDDPDL